MMTNDEIDIIKGLISFIKVENGKFSDTDIKILKGINSIINGLSVENERWITIHPHGKDRDDYRRLKLEDGETPKEAIDRVYKKEKQEYIGQSFTNFQGREEKIEKFDKDRGGYWTSTKVSEKAKTPTSYFYTPDELQKAIEISKRNAESKLKREQENERKPFENLSEGQEKAVIDVLKKQYVMQEMQKLRSKINKFRSNGDLTEYRKLLTKYKKLQEALNSNSLGESISVSNGWVTLQKEDEDGNRIRIFIDGYDNETGPSKWFTKDIEDFKNNKQMAIRLDGLEKDVKNTIGNTVNRINAEYNIKNLVSVSTGPLQRAYAFNLTDMEHNAIRVSKKLFSDSEKLKRTFQNDCDSLFHPKGLKNSNPVEAIIMHELGHSITVAGGKKDFWNEIETIQNKHNDELGCKTIKTLRKNRDKYNTKNLISVYAMQNKYEFVAEAFSDAMLSTNPCKYSNDVLKCIQKHFKLDGKIQKQLKLWNAAMEVLNAMDKEKNKKQEINEDDLWLENYGLGYPTEEGYEEWEKEQEKQSKKEE